MAEVSVKNQVFDEHTAASAGALRIGRITAALPNKFATTSELNASRMIRHKETLPGEVLVAGRLMFPDALKRLLTEDEYLKGFARGLSRDTGAYEDLATLLFLVFRGEAGFEKAEDLRTLLDLQYYSDMDIFTVQQPREISPDEYASLFRFAERWLEGRGLDKPLMPVISAAQTREQFEKCLQFLAKREVRLLGVDMKGGFYYHNLRALEDVKKKRKDIWIHVFQVPPKIRFAGRLLPCSEGMMLPYFGVDSFSRWVVPPPPEPLTKDKINMFDRADWGVFKRKEWRKIHGKRLGCGCPTCKGEDLNGFFLGKVLTVLGRSKVHDHYSQQEELQRAGERIREQRYGELLSSKRYPKSFLDEIQKEG